MNVAHNIARLRAVGRELPPSLHAVIVKDGAAHLSALIELLEDEEASLAKAPDGGFGPMHAALLLAEIGDPRAIESMLGVAADLEWDSLLYQRIIHSLPKFGARAVEPLIGAITLAPDDDARIGLYEALSKLGVRDERIATMLNKLVAQRPELGKLAVDAYQSGLARLETKN